jgi:LPXTG-site transpeptidase (sortase) family protein
MVSRLRVTLAVILLVAGIAATGIGFVLLKATPAKVAKSAVTKPIIVDPTSSATVSIPIAQPIARGPVTEGLRVVLPELGIDLPIVEGDGQDVPLYKAAHYPSMAWPGQGNRSMLYAHARPGMFEPLFKARVGQHIEVRRSNGTVLKYTISEFFPRWPDADLKYLQPTDHEELVLLTCTSWYQGDPKIIAVAQPAA